MQELSSISETKRPYASADMAEPTWKGMAEMIRGLLKDRGDQKRLALRSGVTESSLSRYLSGEKTPDVDDFLALSRALSVPVSQLLGEVPREAKTFEVGPSTTAVIPIVAKEVAAGEARIPMIDEIGPDDAYFFRDDWLRKRHSWKGDPDRFFCIRLAKTSNAAGSMEPTIYADSIVLCDRHPAIARTELRDRSIWLVNDGSGLAVKRVTRQDGALLIESDAVGRRYAPKILPIKGKDINHVLPGKVIWWGTNAAYAEEP